MPKSELGLSDLTKVRPITLMENIVKIFERIIIDRVTKALMKNRILNMEQYGGLPGAGVRDPLRIMAEIIEDANASSQ